MDDILETVKLLACQLIDEAVIFLETLKETINPSESDNS